MPKERPRVRVARPVVLVVMGVAGSGKTTVAERLVERLGWRFQEGDALHPPANVTKMTAGRPLTDTDRWPWLDRVATWIEGCLARGDDGVVTCSALKRAYRERLHRPGVLFVYLAAEFDTISARMDARKGHFMPRSLLRSQFDTLEEPDTDEPAIRVEVTGTTEQAVADIVEQLELGPLPGPART